MSVTIKDCTYMACDLCRRKKFAPVGGKMHETGVCQACRLFGPPKPTARAPVSQAEGPATPGNPFGVQPGQKWRALDKRDAGRIIEVIDLEDDRAIVLSHGIGGVKHRKIRLDQFKPHKGRGYAPVT